MSLQSAFHESLPYIDPEPSPEALTAAIALITAEASNPSSSSTTSSSLSPLPPTSFSPAISAELDRLSSSSSSSTTTTTRQPPLDLSRYEAQEPPIPGSSSTEESQAALSAAYVSDAYLSLRRQNLDLLGHHGKNAWLIANHQLEAELKRLEAELAGAKRDIDIVNIDRQRRQQDVKAEMEILEESWRKGVGNVLQTELAVEELKERIRQEMRSRSAQQPV